MLGQIHCFWFLVVLGATGALTRALVGLINIVVIDSVRPLGPMITRIVGFTAAVILYLNSSHSTIN